MDEAPIVDAVERIEAALSRLEDAAQGLKSATLESVGIQSAALQSAAADSAALHQRHETLKSSVAGSLAQLDALIASCGR